MRLVIRGLIIFVALLVVSALMVEFFNTQFGSSDYFSVHGYFLLLALATFPRLTLLISSIPFGGMGWWLGFIFFPRVLIAILATVNYFKTNPVLVVISWLVALGGEAWEKRSVNNRRFVTYNFARRPARRPAYDHASAKNSEVFEAEARVISKEENP